MMSPRSMRASRATRRTRIAMLFLVLVGVLFAFVFPTRTLLDQRGQVRAAEDHLTVLRKQGAILKREAQRLQSDAEVERLARSKYNLVKPGEQAYAIVSSAPARAATRRAASNDHVVHPAPKSLAWYHRIWHHLVSVL